MHVKHGRDGQTYSHTYIHTYTHWKMANRALEALSSRPSGIRADSVFVSTNNAEYNRVNCKTPINTFTVSHSAIVP